MKDTDIDGKKMRIKCERGILLLILLVFLSRMFLLSQISLAHQGNISVLVRIDEIRYFVEAQKIFTFSGWQGGLWDVPLYPVLLGVLFKIFFPSYFLAVILNIILFSLGVGMLYALTSLVLNKVAAYCAAITMAFYPSLWMISLYPAAEPLVLFLLISTGYTLVKYYQSAERKYLISTAVLSGLLTLTKETFIFLPFIFILIILLKYGSKTKTALKDSLLLSLIYLLVLLPLLILNYGLNNKISLSYKVQRGIYIMKHFDLHAPERIVSAVNRDEVMYGRQTFLYCMKEKDIGTFLKNYFPKRMRFFFGTGTFGLMQALGQDITRLKSLLDRPGEFLRVLAQKGVGWVIFQCAALLMVGYVYFASLYALVVLLVKKKFKETAWLLLFVAYFLVAYVGLNNSRYLVPIVPLLAVLSSYLSSKIYCWIFKLRVV